LGGLVVTADYCWSEQLLILICVARESTLTSEECAAGFTAATRNTGELAC
jgi:hypothetical protein